MVKKWFRAFLTFSILTSLAGVPAIGQKKANFKIVEFGAGPSMVAIYDNSSKINRHAKLSGAADFALVYAIKKNLMVTVHAMYEHKGGKATQVTEPESPHIEFNTNSSYMTFAPGVRRYLGRSSVFIEGGPFIAFLFNSNTVQSADGVETQLGNLFTTLDVGVSGSIGVTPRRRELRGLNFRLVNNLGLADINHNTGVKEWSNSLALIAGIRMRVR